MLKLTERHLERLQENWMHKVKSTIADQASGHAYRDDIEEAIYEYDIADIFLFHVNETFDTSEFDEWDMIYWIRELQHDAILDTQLIPISLEEYIADKFNNSIEEFANAQCINKQQVTKWIKDDFFVLDNQICSISRDLVVI